MKKYYFTYGTEGHPFYGGWTEIYAPDENTACQIFRIFHPDKTPGLLNCAMVYPEEVFKKTCMSGADGSFGYRAHERIVLDRTVGVNI